MTGNVLAVFPLFHSAYYLLMKQIAYLKILQGILILFQYVSIYLYVD